MAEESPDAFEAIDPSSDSLTAEELSTLRTGLTADDPIQRREAARKCSALAVQRPEQFRQLTDDVAPLLEDDRASIAQHAGTALLTVAPDYREELRETVPQVVTLASHDSNAHRLLGANLLATIVVEHPEAAVDDVHRLLPVLHEETGPYEPSEAVTQVDDQDTRRSIVDQEQTEHRMKLESLGTIANVVVAVAEAEPSALFDHVGALSDLFDHDDGTIAGTAIDAAAEVAKADPDVAAPAFDDLVDCLERNDERVQARAVTALGFFEDERAIEPLEELATATDEDDLAELARETAAFLDGQ